MHSPSIPRLHPWLQIAIGLAFSNLGMGQEPPRPLDLREALLPESKAPVPASGKLAPEWIGTIRDGEETLHLRVDHAGRLPSGKGNKPGRIWIGRVSSRGEHVSNEQAEFNSSLPSTQEIKSAKALAQLRSWFGAQPNWSDAWGDGTSIHSFERWGCFTQTSDGNLRWLQILAHTAYKREDGDREDLVQIEDISIAEGILRPADPNSKEEKELYLTADQIQEQEDKKRAAERAKKPEPLRSLIAAREAPHDNDLAAYRRALDKIRRNPDPVLFRQIAAFDQDGTGWSYLRDILDQTPPLRSLEPWAAEDRNKTLRSAVDALSAANSPGKLMADSITLMGAMGGGRIIIGTPAIDLTATGNGGYTQSKWDVNEENQAKAATALTKWFDSRL
ncbi:MAG: hypothetical protein QM755_07915 [Luteolibacter sp.]